MRVIVTRPEASAVLTAEKIGALGHEPFLLPLFRPEHFPDAVRVALAEKPGGLILTSAEAARCLASMDLHGLDVLSLPLHAVGDATARAAASLGFTDIRVSGGDGGALAAQIARRHQPDTPPFLYLAGETRSPGLESSLAQLDIPIRVAVAYRMVAVEHSPARLVELDLPGETATLLLYSREAAIRFAKLVDDHPAISNGIGLILCLSPAIVAALPPQLAGRARAATEPREDQLLAMLPRV